MIEVEIDTTKAHKALDSLQEKIKETQAQLDAMNAATSSLTKIHSDNPIVRYTARAHVALLDWLERITGSREHDQEVAEFMRALRAKVTKK
jgi:hypothetical protein